MLSISSAALGAGDLMSFKTALKSIIVCVPGEQSTSGQDIAARFQSDAVCYALLGLNIYKQ